MSVLEELRTQWLDFWRRSFQSAGAHAHVPRNDGNCGMEGLVAIAQSAHGLVANVNFYKILVESEVKACAVRCITYWAHTGTGPFKGKEPVKKRCVLASLYPERVHVIAGKDQERIKTDIDARRALPWALQVPVRRSEHV